MNENIKKFEYYIFIKKIKEKIHIKNRIKTNIIIFQKRSALDQLLINVIYKMKNEILNEKIKRLLIKKFIYKNIHNFQNNHKKIKSNEKNNNKITNELFLNRNNLFNNFVLKMYIHSFLEKSKSCIKNTKLYETKLYFREEKRIYYLKKFFQNIKRFKPNNKSKEKRILLQKIFFIEIKNIILYKSNKINIITKLNNTKKLFIYKNIFHLFLKNYKSKKEEINKNNLMKQKKEIFKEKQHSLINKKIYFKTFIHRTKNMKQTNALLKRKIFNILKTNVIMAKDLKYYLNEAEEIL